MANDKARFFETGPQPTKRKEPVEHLRDWAVGLSRYLQETSVYGRLAWFLYRPHRQADEALFRLATSHPQIVQELRETVTHCDTCRDAIDGGDAAEAALGDAMMVLLDRIRWTCGIVEGEQSAKQAAPADDSSANRANIPKLFPKGPIDRQDIRDFVIRMSETPAGEKSQNGIAREITGEPADTHPLADSLLARARTLRGEGKVFF